MHVKRLFGTTALFSLLLLSGCASHQPLKVSVTGIKPAGVAGLGMRMMVNLRVQNPNEVAVDYKGVALDMKVQGKKFASGTSDSTGSVPSLGEAVVSVPVTVSAMDMIKKSKAMLKSAWKGKFSYEVKGKLNSPSLGSKSFKAKGELDLTDLKPD